MSEPVATHATMEVPPADTGGHASPDLMSISGSMMALTWITFLLVTVILYKVAWKPILSALDRREADIRKAIEDAARIREELAKIEDVRKAVIAEADTKAKDIVDAARQAAIEAAAHIESKARDEAQIVLKNAQSEIRAAQEKAIASLRKESADLAILLARKVIGENLDEARSRSLTEKLIKEM